MGNVAAFHNGDNITNNYVDVGFSLFGVALKQFGLMSASATDADMIKGFFASTEYDGAKHIYESSEILQAEFADVGLEFPGSREEIPGWLDDMTEEQGQAVCKAF